jgi:transcriptional regulator with XRE-family HTH domain
MTFGERLRRLRRERYLSQSELAARSKVSKNTIIRIESGSYSAHPSTIRKLAEALGVEPSAIASPDELTEHLAKKDAA